MALQSTANTANPLKFSEIKTEFAASANNLRAYLKGAGIVDSNDTAPNVPSSGTISSAAKKAASAFAHSAFW